MGNEQSGMWSGGMFLSGVRCGVGVGYGVEWVVELGQDMEWSGQLTEWDVEWGHGLEWSGSRVLEWRQGIEWSGRALSRV